MSWKALQWATRQLAGLSAGEQLTLIHLADIHNQKDGECYPAIQTLAERTGFGTTKVRESLRSLEQMGLVATGKSGGKVSNSYVLNPAGDFALTRPEMTAKRTVDQHEKHRQTQRQALGSDPENTPDFDPRTQRLALGRTPQPDAQRWVDPSNPTPGVAKPVHRDQRIQPNQSLPTPTGGAGQDRPTARRLLMEAVIAEDHEWQGVDASLQLDCINTYAANGKHDGRNAAIRYSNSYKANRGIGIQHRRKWTRQQQIAEGRKHIADEEQRRLTKGNARTVGDLLTDQEEDQHQ